MNRGVRIGLAALAAVMLGGAAAAQAPYRSLTQAFADFATSTADQPMADRVRAFRARFGRLFPDFYRPRDGHSAADYDLIVARALRGFPAQQAEYETVARDFPAAFDGELAHFRAAFPGFRPTGPIYLLHSLGEMDGGTRMIGKRRVLIFAADGIATLDTPDSVPMLLDHEFFHMAHTRFFAGCYAVWCTLWREGLATYAAASLHPGATDRQIALDFPQPLRPAVDAHWRQALCLLRENLDATGRSANRLFFLADGGRGMLPPRFGYYLAFRIAQRIASGRSLNTLMQVPMWPVHLLLREQIGEMAAEAGGCNQVDIAIDTMFGPRPAQRPGATPGQ